MSSMSSISSPRLAITVAAAALLLGACAAPHRAPPSHGKTDTSLTQDQDYAVSRAIRQNEGWDLEVKQDIAFFCPGTAPTEEGSKDPAWVNAQRRTTLRALATCLTDGSLRTQDLVLTGHAGPRGWAVYGMCEGEKRAEAIRDALVALGVPAGRVFVEAEQGHPPLDGSVVTLGADTKVEIGLATKGNLTARAR
jgi:outer membrane protein OmpA-like peptidoglycan-associated protein